MDLYKEIKRAMKRLKKAGGYRDNRYYFYRLPSPNEGKVLEIIGPVGPMYVGQAVNDVWTGKKKPEEIEYMKEVDIRDLMIFTEDR